MRRTHGGPTDYLHDCLALHGQVTEMRDGRGQDLFRIEDETDNVQTSCRLTYDDIEKIRNSRIWNADAFGYWPSRSQIDSILESAEWNFRTLPEKEEQVIEGLLEMFHQIELVSVILRFVVPKHYGILSPPVEKVLGIGPFRKHSQKYLAYLDNLREIRDARKFFRSAAEVDMALWVLQVGVLDDDLLKRDLSDEEYESLYSGFRNDSKLREIRVGNLTRQLFSEMSRVELSEALLATDVELAGQIAGIQFEQDVRRLTRAKPDDKLADLVRAPRFLRSVRQIPDIHADFWWNAVRTRNKAIHLNPPPKKGHVMKLVEGMKAVRRLADGDGLDELSADPADFWEWRSIDELGGEQGIDAPQQFDGMIGAAAGLWDDEEDFERFVKGTRERRHRIETHVEDDG